MRNTLNLEAFELQQHWSGDDLVTKAKPKKYTAFVECGTDVQTHKIFIIFII